jgi:hypothetical protein
VSTKIDHSIAELLDQATAEVRHGLIMEDLAVTADKLAVTLWRLRRAGDAHGVPVGADVLNGPDAVQAWPWLLSDRAVPSPLAGDHQPVLARLLDHAAHQLDDGATAEVVALGAAKLAGLLVVVHASTRTRGIPTPGRLDELIRGLGAFALALRPRHLAP